MAWRRLRPGLAVVLFLVASCATRQPQPPPQPPQAAAPAAPAPAAIVQRGKASYYADHFDGRTTADGSQFDQDALTAASKVIPLGARAHVTNLSNGKTVTVEVNDRGPHVRGRVVDLSRSAAQAIGIDDGIATVEVEARVDDQATPDLKEKVAAIAAARAAKKKKSAAMRQANGER
jgi:rare lipoprotein A